MTAGALAHGYGPGSMRRRNGLSCDNVGRSLVIVHLLVERRKG